jgi:hypothetical protein
VYACVENVAKNTNTHVPVIGRGSLQDCEMLKSYILDNELTDGCEDVNHTHLTVGLQRNIIYVCPCYSFLLESEQTTRFRSAGMIR